MKISALLLALILTCSSAIHAESPRRFQFRYAGAITDLKPGQSARIWLPIAESTPDQEVKRTATSVGGGVAFKIGRDPDHQNAILYFESQANPRGEIEFQVDYEIRRRPVVRGAGAPAPAPLDEYLKADSRVPILGVVNRVFEKAPIGDPKDMARRIYDQVDHHMRYDKPQDGGWGNGDTSWACEAGYGNCTDFHSLYISLCREMGLPARFEIGFPIPVGKRGKVGGYHCWAATAVDGRWLSVDISEADKAPAKRDYYFGNLDADRVKFTHGRDIKLQPRNASGPVNYFIYPHAEVDGEAHGKFRKAFQFTAGPKSK